MLKPEELKKIRKWLGYNQSKLAVRLGLGNMGYKHIGAIETKRKPMSKRVSEGVLCLLIRKKLVSLAWKMRKEIRSLDKK